MKRKLFLAGILLLLLLMACSPPSLGRRDAITWQYGDLILLDEVDAPQPGLDLLAVYARLEQQTIEVRLDFLDLGNPHLVDVYILFDTLPGGSRELPFQATGQVAWDVMLWMPASMPAAVVYADDPLHSVSEPRVIFNVLQDTLSVQIERRSLPRDLNHARIQVFTIDPGSTVVADQTAPFPLQNLANLPQAPLLLAFWDVFPAQTPAQALRRWDGAHTGPYGQRHGLLHLLKAAQQYRLPLALLDLKTPASLSALDALGQIDWVRHMQSEGLLILPDAAYGDPLSATTSLSYSQRVGRSFGLADSRIAFAALPWSNDASYCAFFADLDDRRHIDTVRGQRLIPLPSSLYRTPSVVPEYFVNRDGLTLAAKKALVQTALSEDPADLIVLGGDLAASPLADSSVAPFVFEYLAGHPWIHVLNETDVLTLSAGKVDRKPVQIKSWMEQCGDLLCSPSQQGGRYTARGEWLGAGVIRQQQAQMRQDLAALPSGPLTDLAWQAFLTLTAPTVDLTRQTLQANYLRQVNRLIRAAVWATNPKDINVCWQDEDGGECVLASQTQYTAYEIAGARLLLAIRLDNGYPVQWLGPLSQFAIGLSDPTDWRLEQGPGADPGEIPGAFADPDESFMLYQAFPETGKIRFIRQDQLVQKEFLLAPDGIEVVVETGLPYFTRIPLVSDPLRRFRKGWIRESGRSAELAQDGNWCQAGIRVQNAQLSRTSFRDSLALLGKPEDPDFHYPAGHYLPFSATVLQLQAAGSFKAALTFCEN